MCVCVRAPDALADGKHTKAFSVVEMRSFNSIFFYSPFWLHYLYQHDASAREFRHFEKWIKQKTVGDYSGFSVLGDWCLYKNLNAADMRRQGYWQRHTLTYNNYVWKDIFLPNLAAIPSMTWQIEKQN